jgi:hypothetical protein
MKARQLRALAHLARNDPVSARRALGKTMRINNNLTAIVALRNGEFEVAQQAFSETVIKADERLEYTDRNFDAWDTKGLALSGLALCDDPRHATTATEAFFRARQINKDMGIIRGTLLLFEMLAVVDQQGLLTDVQWAVRGEPVKQPGLP